MEYKCSQQSMVYLIIKISVLSCTKKRLPWNNYLVHKLKRGAEIEQFLQNPTCSLSLKSWDLLLIAIIWWNTFKPAWLLWYVFFIIPVFGNILQKAANYLLRWVADWLSNAHTHSLTLSITSIPTHFDSKLYQNIHYSVQNGQHIIFIHSRTNT